MLFMGKDVIYRNLAYLSEIIFLEGNLREINYRFIFLGVKNSYDLNYFPLLKKGPSLMLEWTTQMRKGETESHYSFPEFCLVADPETVLDE